MKSYPIWHEVQACHYQSSKSYGGRNNSGDKISVGNSRNSHELISTMTTRRFMYDKKTEAYVVTFVYFVDGHPLKGLMFKADGEKVKGEPIASFDYTEDKEIQWNYKE